jgi:uncharacterized protein
MFRRLDQSKSYFASPPSGLLASGETGDLDMKLLLAVAALALLTTGCVLHPPPMSAGQIAAVADPPRDPAHPARNRQLVIPSGPVLPALGRPAEMNALMLQAAGAGPHPTMLLLHGLPGNERNMDLAQAARRSGWNVLTFTYRGAWGSEGTFSIQHAVEDSHAALAWLRSEAAARDYGVDPARIVVAGHSMGGMMAAYVATHDTRGRLRVVETCEAGCPEIEVRGANAPAIAGVILIDAWDIAADARRAGAAGEAGRAALVAAFDDVGHALGPITAADLADNILRRGTEWDLMALAPELARTRLLTVYATHGGAEENRAFAQAIRLGCPISGEIRPGCNGLLTTVEMDTDHAFADRRVALAREVVGWLARQ